MTRHSASRCVDDGGHLPDSYFNSERPATGATGFQDGRLRPQSGDAGILYRRVVVNGGMNGRMCWWASAEYLDDCSGAGDGDLIRCSLRGLWLTGKGPFLFFSALPQEDDELASSASSPSSVSDNVITSGSSGGRTTWTISTSSSSSDARRIAECPGVAV